MAELAELLCGGGMQIVRHFGLEGPNVTITWYGRQSDLLDRLFRPGTLLLYAFSLSGLTVYLGRSDKGGIRIYQHGQAGNRKQPHDAPSMLLATLEAGRQVEIGVLLVEVPIPHFWPGLPMAPHAGTEHALLRIYRPPWNGDLSEAARRAWIPRR